MGQKPRRNGFIIVGRLSKVEERGALRLQTKDTKKTNVSRLRLQVETKKVDP